MLRIAFERQLSQINDEILLLGSMVEQAMFSAVDALKRRDVIRARQVYLCDAKINEKRFAIENAILITIATQQPIAHDLRKLAANLEIITELERMGDYAKGITKVVIKLGDEPLPIPHLELGRMCEKAVSMLHRALSAFIAEDTNQASIIPTEDDEVDNLYNAVHRIIVKEMITRPEIIDHGNQIMWVAHNLERMADRVTNICERTVFIVTGELLEIEHSDDEDEDDVIQ